MIQADDSVCRSIGYRYDNCLITHGNRDQPWFSFHFCSVKTSCPMTMVKIVRLGEDDDLTYGEMADQLASEDDDSNSEAEGSNDSPDGPSDEEVDDDESNEHDAHGDEEEEEDDDEAEEEGEEEEEDEDV